MASIAKREDGKWRARYVDPDGRQHAKHFERKVDATAWLDQKRGELAAGDFIDPAAGKVTFKEYAESWRAAQVHRPHTAEQVEQLLRCHVYPTFGDRQLASIRRSELQAWTKGLATTLSPTSITHTFRWCSTIFRSAVDDGLIRATPCRGVKLPRAQRVEVVPPETGEVEAVLAAIEPRLRAAVMLAAGTGLRQGEVCGLTVDRIDFLRRTVRVDRQLVTASGQAPYLGPVKTAASVRTVPLPQVVVDALARHLAAYPAGAEGFVFTLADGAPISRQRLSRLWRGAADAAGLDADVGFHSLRHYYASLLIRAAESVVVVQKRLGHSNAAETLNTYSHLWPDSDDRTREAVDAVLGATAQTVRENLGD